MIMNFTKIKNFKIINMKQFYLLIAGCLLFLTQATANNLVISGTPSYSSANQTLTFTMSWDNSWSINAGPTNWDAVWIFIKRQNCAGKNEWVHQKLATTSGDHSAKLASNSATSTDVQVDAVGDGMGVFVRRIGTNVVGNVASQIVTLKLASTNPIITTSNTDNFEILGIEMVYVPEGEFYAGDGRVPNTFNFSAGTSTQPVLINALKQTNGIGSAINYTSSNAYGSPVPLPATFPLGYKGFYCMKYEATIGIFAEFINSLNYDQQANHLNDVGGGSNLPNVQGAYFDCSNCWAMWTKVTTPGVYNTVAAIFTPQFPYQVEGNLSWKASAAFLDWSGLRPMTEFEFEKACRGPLVPVANEYPWGSTTISVQQVASNYGDPNANTAIVEGPCFYNGWDGSPQRPGAFARSTTNRSQSGATYYGILDMAGNVVEQCVGGAGFDYSTFTTANGDGALSSSGYANTTGWPSSGGVSSGTIFRGGWYATNNPIYSQVSDRAFYTGKAENSYRWKYNGARGVRSFAY